VTGDQSAYSWTEAEKDMMEGIDTTVPHSARIWNYWLGGKDNYPVDRAAGDAFLQAYPGMAAEARANRQFLARAIGYLVTEAGVRQFLDIGTGLPTADNTHEIAQRLLPASRIVYVDNDPLVLAHARALLTSSPGGVTDYLDADLRDTDQILEQAAQTLDFTRPVAVILLAILHYIPDLEECRRVMDRLTEAVPSGSFVVMSHAASDIDADQMAEMIRRMNEYMGDTTHVGRTRDTVAEFFAGLDLVEPGVVKVTEWRPESEQAAKGPTSLWGGVAQKP
jgi:O-methyltransferase involved in polyketide biosynthesis